jgi:hypothetical protein
MIGNSFKLKSKLEKKSTSELTRILVSSDSKRYDDETIFLIKHIIQERGGELPTVNATVSEPTEYSEAETQTVINRKVDKKYEKYVNNFPNLSPEEIQRSLPMDVFQVFLISMIIIDTLLIISMIIPSSYSRLPQLIFIGGIALTEYLVISKRNLLDFLRWRGFIAVDSVIYFISVIFLVSLTDIPNGNYSSEGDLITGTFIIVLIACVLGFASGWLWISMRDNIYKNKTLEVYDSIVTIDDEDE